MSTPQVSDHGGRLAEIDALRGIAAVLVVLFHYTTRFDQSFGHTQALAIEFPWAHIGVNLFFIISGFVIFLTLGRTRHASEFVVSRFSRLFPAYWASVVVTFVVISSLGLPGKQVTGDDAVLNLLMFHGSFGVPHVDAVYWTLEVELLFYAMAFSLFLLGQLHRVHWFLYALISLKVIYAVSSRHFGVDLPWRIEWALILPFIPWFACGIAIYRLTHDSSTRRHDYAILGLAVLALGYVDGPGLGLLCIAFSALVWLAANKRLTLLRNPIILWLGFISYPLYLLHENIGWSVIRVVEHAGYSPWLAIGAASALALTLASLMSVYVERPAMQWIRAQFKNGRTHAEGWQRLGKTIPLVALVLIGPVYGISARANNARSPTVVQPQANDAIDCSALRQGKPLVLLVLGQSNAANHGVKQDKGERVPVIHNGRCYRSADPLPGGTGTGGSIWSHLPAAWAALGETRMLAFSIVAVESTAIREWARPGELLERTSDQLAGLRRLGLKPDAVLWLQGEADARDSTSEADYLARLQQLSARLSQAGSEAPIFIARATRCKAHYSDAVRRAQTTAAAQTPSMMAGPDLDQLDGIMRRDACHFSADGLQEAARLWATTLSSNAERLARPDSSTQ